MNTMTMDPYGNSKLIIPRSNSTSDLFNVENFIPSCPTTNLTTSNNNNNNNNNIRRNRSINYSKIINVNNNNYDSRASDQSSKQYQYMKRFDQSNNNNNNTLYTNGQTLRRSNTTVTRTVGNNNNNNIVPSKNSKDLHKYVVNNNMVRRSNTLNPNMQQQRQQQQSQNVKRSNTQNYNNNNNNYNHIFNVNTKKNNNNNPRRNNTINVSSSTGQRKYSKINTFKNFEQYYNHNHNTRIKNLSPLQIQRNKMKNEFNFPNGEQFTPRKIEKSYSPIPPPTPAITQTPIQHISLPTKQNQPLKRSNSKKFGSFWKKIIGKESKEKELPKIQITQTSSTPPIQSLPIQTPPLPPHEPVHLGDDDSTLPILTEISSTDQQDFDSSKLIERLTNQWEIIHEDSSISQISNRDSIIDSYLVKTNVSFGNEIFVNETYSPEEYDRADPEEFIPVKDRKLVFDNEFGFIDEIKYEVNQFKRNEMMIHIDSIKFVQFCK